MSARLEHWDDCATSTTVLCTSIYGNAMIRWSDAPAPRPFAGSSFACAYCKTVSAWRAGDAPPRKCWACGAPRQE